MFPQIGHLVRSKHLLHLSFWFKVSQTIVCSLLCFVFLLVLSRASACVLYQESLRQFAINATFLFIYSFIINILLDYIWSVRGGNHVSKIVMTPLTLVIRRFIDIMVRYRLLHFIYFAFTVTRSILTLLLLRYPNSPDFLCHSEMGH